MKWLTYFFRRLKTGEPNWKRRKWRTLQEGEIVQAGDWYDACNDGWRDLPIWKPVTKHSIGRKAASPLYPSHTKFRRLL